MEAVNSRGEVTHGGVEALDIAGPRKKERRREPFNRVGDTVGGRPYHPSVPTAIVVQCWARVVARLPMHGPGGTVLGLVVNNNEGTEWGDRVGEEIVFMTVDASVCGDGGVWAIRPKMIEREFGLGQAEVPEIHREGRVDGAQGRDDVVLGHLYRSLRLVGAVRAWGDVLVGHTFNSENASKAAEVSLSRRTMEGMGRRSFLKKAKARAYAAI